MVKNQKSLLVILIGVFLLMGVSNAVNYTSTEVATHNTATDCWVSVSNVIYDATAYLGNHPGGSTVITCGSDNTALYTGTSAHKGTIATVLTKVGDLTTNTGGTNNTTTNNNTGGIFVNDVTIQEVSGEYFVLMSLGNTDPTKYTYTELKIQIQELGTTKIMGAFRVPNAGTAFKFNLRDVTDSFPLLKKGSSYQIAVSTDKNTRVESFVYGGVLVGNSATGVVLDKVKVNGEQVLGTDNLQVLNGETLKVSVKVTALRNLDNARFNALIEGYEHRQIIASSEIFSLVSGKTYIKTFDLVLPNDMNTMQNYKLRIFGANDLSGITYKELDLYIDTQRHRIDIKDLVLSPSTAVEIGGNFIANVRLQNRGQRSQPDVKVSVSIPKLNLLEEGYVTNLNPGDVITSGDMLFSIPDTAKTGQYEVEVKVSYNDQYTNSVKKYPINIIAARTTPNKKLIVKFNNNLDLIGGITSSFNVIVANPNGESKPVSLLVADNTWANVKVTPSLAMIKTGEDATFTVQVTPKLAIVGEKSLKLALKEGTNMVEEFTVKSYVKEGNNTNWLNIILGILLLVGIIILILLIIKISKKKNERAIEENESIKEISNKKRYY